MNFLIKNKIIRCLLFSLNLIFACLPFWHTGTMVICQCGGHFSIELKDYQDCGACCNDCEGARNRSENSPLICCCASIPISKDLNDHTACYTNAEKYDKIISCFDHRISRIIDSEQQKIFYPLAQYPVTANNPIDILRTIILLI
jgi:hypothetical protein